MAIYYEYICDRQNLFFSFFQYFTSFKIFVQGLAEKKISNTTSINFQIVCADMPFRGASKHTVKMTHSPERITKVYIHIYVQSESYIRIYSITPLIYNSCIYSFLLLTLPSNTLRMLLKICVIRSHADADNSKVCLNFLCAYYLICAYIHLLYICVYIQMNCASLLFDRD